MGAIRQILRGSNDQFDEFKEIRKIKEVREIKLKRGFGGAFSTGDLTRIFGKPPVKLTNQNLGCLVLVALSFVLQRFALLGNLEALHGELVLLFLPSVRHRTRLLASRTGRTVAVRLALTSLHGSCAGDVAEGGVLSRLHVGLGGNQTIFDNLRVLKVRKRTKMIKTKRTKVQQVWKWEGVL